MKDIFERIKENPGPLGQFADYGEGYFIFPRLEGPIGPRMKFQGKEVIFRSANDYLGLCNHPEVLEADKWMEEQGFINNCAHNYEEVFKTEYIK